MFTFTNQLLFVNITKNMKKLFLIDAYAMIYRSYFAFSKNPRFNSDGFETSAIYGFVNSITELLSNEDLTHLGVVFDTPQKTHRHIQYVEYKANRDAMPEGISGAIPYIKNILTALNIPILFVDGFEADDVIGTLAKQASNQEFLTYMVTPDKDFAQLVSDSIFMYRPGNRGSKHQIWNVKTVCEKFGIDYVHQVVDYLGMVGDAVDNIPGIAGVGPKTASKLLKKYGSLEEVYKSIENLEGKLKEKIINSHSNAILSKQLAKIVVDVPIQLDSKDLKIIEPNWDQLNAIFKELEFRRLNERIRKVFSYNSSEPTIDIDSASRQLSLFSSDNKPTSQSSDSAIQLDSYQEIKDAVKNLELESSIGISLYNADNNISGLSIFSNTNHYYIFFTKTLIVKICLLTLEPLFVSKNIMKIYFDSKNVFKLLAQYKINFCDNFFDVTIADYLINPENNRSLSNIAHRNNLDSLHLDSIDMNSEEGVKYYLIETSLILIELYKKQLITLEKNDLTPLFKDVEKPLVKVLLQMEFNGVRIDTVALNNYSNKLTQQITLLTDQIHKLANQNFNIASPKQLGEVLFQKMKLSEKPKKTKSGQFSTNENELVKLKNTHPIIEKILLYRTYQKLLSTYVNALPSLIEKGDKKIHTTFNQTVTNTGRLSSSSPNLQNIPIRKKSGKDVRRAFIASDKNHILMAADYSQIELRLIAELSKEETMIKAFLKEEDIHKSTASKVFKVDLDKVTSEMRSNAKVVNFGIIYGVSAFGLSEQSTLNRKEASELIKIYFETYPMLKKYIDDQIYFAKENGYVQTILGRKRYLRNINSRNSFIRGHDERNAVNMPVQGSAADLIKLAMINIHNEFRANSFKSKLILQVHDELVFDVHNSEKEIIQNTVRHAMENIYNTKVPLKVDIGFGANWLDAH
ncbi:MAG: DNA polymerase I [Flavobacteriales bacterium TMED191]|nr:MAG: DNA polymerase I [Flavobacteriales bacterium TMED191]|tara:strand:+ start:1076 stop:3823 length:2748 start_codon:yes stop_codon:yes gene_type:complete